MDRLYSKAETVYERLHDVVDAHDTVYGHWSQWKQEEKTAYP
jgi:hypothetical protein